jgi:hypothetical protein
MKMIFEPMFVLNKIIFTRHKLVVAINYLAHHKVHVSNYAEMIGAERRTWL